MKTINKTTKEKEMNLKIILFVLTLLLLSPFVLSAANYGAGAYGAGVYGQASCGDAICEAGETCSSCSSDCGVCAPDQVYGVILDYKFIEKINSWVNIPPGGTVLINDFDEDYGINSIRMVVGEESKQSKITVRKYNSKPEEVFVEAPGIIYKYLQIETENFENLTKATINIQVMKDWISDNGVDIENVSLYKFNESLSEWIKLNTNFVNEDEEGYFYDIVLSSFSFFAISGESLVPVVPGFIPGLPGIDEIEILDKLNLRNLGWILIVLAIFVSVIASIVILIKIRKDKELEFIERQKQLGYISNYMSKYHKLKKEYDRRKRIIEVRRSGRYNKTL